MPNDHVSAVEGVTSKEIERSKRVQIPYSAQIPLVTLPEYSTSFRLDQLHKTTIESAPQTSKIDKNVSSSRPQLPDLNYAKQPTVLGLEIVRAIQKNEEILNGIVHILIKNIHVHNEAIVKLSEEEQKSLNELLDELSKKENISTVKTLLNVVTSSAAITIGAVAASAAGAAISSTSLVGSCLLIASGALNLVTNEVFPRLGMFEKIAGFFTDTDAAKRNLADNIQMTTTLANTVMGIASSIAASSLITKVLEWSNGLKLLNSAVSLSDSVLNFITGMYEHTHEKLESEQTTIDGKVSKEQTALDRNYTQLHSATDLQEAFNKASYNIFETIKKMQEENTK